MDRLAAPPAGLDTFGAPGLGHALLAVGEGKMERRPVGHDRHGGQRQRPGQKLQRAKGEVARGRAFWAAAAGIDEGLVATGPFGLRFGEEINGEDTVAAEAAGEAIDESGILASMQGGGAGVEEFGLMSFQGCGIGDSHPGGFDTAREAEPLQPHLDEAEQMVGRGRRAKQSDVEPCTFLGLALETDLDTNRSAAGHGHHLGRPLDKLPEDEFQCRPLVYRVFEKLFGLELLGEGQGENRFLQAAGGLIPAAEEFGPQTGIEIGTGQCLKLAEVLEAELAEGIENVVRQPQGLERERGEKRNRGEGVAGDRLAGRLLVEAG